MHADLILTEAKKHTSKTKPEEVGQKVMCTAKLVNESLQRELPFVINRSCNLQNICKGTIHYISGYYISKIVVVIACFSYMQV